jgi:hypothetical protein
MTTPVPVALADESSMARGNLSIELPKRHLSLTLAHAYFISGNVLFDATRTFRSIVFTADERRATIDACTNLSCAMMSSSDCLTIDIDESGMINWRVHIFPMQVSGSANGNALKLTAESADRLAGTFSLDGPHVKTTIEFDAALVRYFPRGE